MLKRIFRILSTRNIFLNVINFHMWLLLPRHLNFVTVLEDPWTALQNNLILYSDNEMYKIRDMEAVSLNLLPRRYLTNVYSYYIYIQLNRNLNKYNRNFVIMSDLHDVHKKISKDERGDYLFFSGASYLIFRTAVRILI